MVVLALLWFGGVVGIVLGGGVCVGPCSVLLLGAVGGAFMMHLCAYSVAWSRAMVSIVSDGRPCLMRVPPLASVMDVF